MKNFWLKFTTKSDSTFGRGDGVAGLVDVEVTHDKYGLPFLSGRTLKGLLEEECANILFALGEQSTEEKDYKKFHESAQHLFGNPGSTELDKSILHISNANIPESLRKLIMYEFDRSLKSQNISNEDILNSLTSIRHQTSIGEESGASKKKSLRSIRVILRETYFEAELVFTKEPSGLDLPLLAACIKAFRRAGTGRNRGKGELVACLHNGNNIDVTSHYFSEFCSEVMR